VKGTATSIDTAVLELSKSELHLIGSVLNEICNGIGIEDWEFETRIGATRSDAQRLLAEVWLFWEDFF
jgi:hypothetical protein